MIAFATFNHLIEHRQYLKSSLDKISWIPLAVIVIVIWTRNAGILPVLHNLIAALYPTDIRTQSIGITQAIFLVGGATCLKFFPNMKTAIGWDNLKYLKLQLTHHTHVIINLSQSIISLE